MSRFLNRSGYDVFYTDTDSLFTNKPLSPEIIDDKKLGLMKLESQYNCFISIGPKCWIGVDKDGNVTCKVKGFNQKLTALNLKVVII